MPIFHNPIIQLFNKYNRGLVCASIILSLGMLFKGEGAEPGPWKTAHSPWALTVMLLWLLSLLPPFFLHLWSPRALSLSLFPLLEAPVKAAWSLEAPSVKCSPLRLAFPFSTLSLALSSPSGTVATLNPFVPPPGVSLTPVPTYGSLAHPSGFGLKESVPDFP